MKENFILKNKLLKIITTFLILMGIIISVSERSTVEAENEEINASTKVSEIVKPTSSVIESDFHLLPAHINYTIGYYVRMYNYPDAAWTGDEVLAGTPVGVIRKAIYKGETWYKLDTNNWVKAQYVVASDPKSSNSQATNITGILTISYVPGYGIAVYQIPGSNQLVYEKGRIKRLQHGTSWKTFKKQIVNGITYFNVGGNQWVDGRYITGWYQ